MKNFVIGLILGLLILPVGGFLFLWSGKAPAATSDPPFPFEKQLAMMALHKAVERDAPKTVPIQADEANLTAGANVYNINCASCHGSIGGEPSNEAKGMFPAPPQLLVADDMVTDDPPGATYWKVKNGIRLTGMPAFHGALSDKQMWQVSLMLSQADKLPAKVNDILKASGKAPGAMM
jgi:thiosulfate dehydrogenase